MLLPVLLMSGLVPAAPAPSVRVFHDDGGWCWFEDERAIVSGGKLIFGVVASGRKGNVEAVTYDLKSGEAKVFVLHKPDTAEEQRRWMDDHNSPAFLLRPDGRVLAMYAKHGVDEKIYYRVSEPKNPGQWGEERIFVPSATSKVTYSNPHYLPMEKRIYNFFRGIHNSFKPSYAYSEDLGETWTAGNVFINVPTQFRHRPYVKYASNGRDTVHIAYTDGHPRDFDNSIYHIYYRNGMLHRSDGKPIRALKEGLQTPEEGTLVYKGGPKNVAWISDLHLDGKGNPVLVFSEQRDPSGSDHRYHYARWAGGKWRENEIAHAGSRLYKGEDDYTGNVALDPKDTDRVYISTNADPVSGTALPHYEIYLGVTKDGGAKWTWTAVTKDSSEDNIRPICPIVRGGPPVLWLRGKMLTYTNYRFQVVGLAGK
ncbi:MAG: BNR-4 repeat-containing protein [Bryobacterales bacterium]|nr:BNR-4 repeat-containing protein [Bryobacterales bacterium]